MIALQTVTESAAKSALDLGGGYSLANPLMLGLLPVLLLLTLWGRRSSARLRGRVAVLPLSGAKSWAQRLDWLAPLFKALGLVCLVVALARPLRGNVESDIVSEGVDIALVIDRSGSMRHQDLQKGKTRLDVVKDVVSGFAQRRMSDTEGAADNVGLISFARFPELLCPFTLDVAAIQGFIEQVELVTDSRLEDGTGIGVALAKAVSVLRSSDAKERIIVLLTDGENNVEDIQPLEAATLAAEEKIRVYTIYSARYLYVHDPFRGEVASNQPPDTTELESIAELTNGRFFRARDREDLEGIYSEIEALERTPREEQRYEETFDLYLRFLLPALLLLGLSELFRSTWARRVG